MGGGGDLWGPHKFSDGASDHLIFWHKLWNLFVLLRRFLYFTKRRAGDLFCHTLHWFHWSSPVMQSRNCLPLHFVLGVSADQIYQTTLQETCLSAFYQVFEKVWICFGVILKGLRGEECREECQRAPVKRHQISQRSTNNNL